MIEPWPNIRTFYEKYGLVGMAQLVRQIENSPYVDGLYAWTSMHDLCVIQHPVDPSYSPPHIKVSPLYDGTVEFRYIDTAIEKKQYRRLAKEEGAFSRLERIIDQLHWFSGTATLNTSE